MCADGSSKLMGTKGNKVLCQINMDKAKIFKTTHRKNTILSRTSHHTHSRSRLTRLTRGASETLRTLMDNNNNNNRLIQCVWCENS